MIHTDIVLAFTGTTANVPYMGCQQAKADVCSYLGQTWASLSSSFEGKETFKDHTESQSISLDSVDSLPGHGRYDSPTMHGG